MSGDEQGSDFSGFIARSSLGETGVRELSARTSAPAVASILRRIATEQFFDELDEDVDDAGLLLDIVALEVKRSDIDEDPRFSASARTGPDSSNET